MSIPQSSSSSAAPVAGALLAATALAQCPPSFVLTGDFAAGSAPNAVAVADFNRDGIPDVALSNGSSNNVSILLGNPAPNAGTFQPALNFPVGAHPTAIAVGDFNRDGRPDLAVTSNTDGTVSILLNSPAPSISLFQTAVAYNVSMAPTSVAVGDFNRDGILDLAVANQIGNTVSILLGSPAGDGTFQPKTDFAASVNPIAVAVGDFNADGRPDLAVSNLQSHNVSILFADPQSTTGKFLAPVNFFVGQGPRSIAVGDFNGDGRPDIVTSNERSRNVSVLISTGPLNSGAFLPAVNYPAGTNPASVRVADLNGDGRPDLAVANIGTGSISILLGNDPALGGTFQPQFEFAIAKTALAIEIADFDGDGRPDLVGANPEDNNVSVRLNETLRPGPTNACCPADINNSGAVTVQDIFDFLALFFTGCP